MEIDIRAQAAQYYDCNPDVPDDLPFYISHIPSPHAAVLELGCGTGRVTLPLVQHCGYIHGLDLSPAMISICKRKLAETGIPPTRARVEVGEITDFDLGQTFDFIDERCYEAYCYPVDSWLSCCPRTSRKHGWVVWCQAGDFIGEASGAIICLTRGKHHSLSRW